MIDRPLSWEQVHRDVLRLARAVRPLLPLAGLVAVSRGGLVPAAILAQALDIRRLEVVCVTTYQGKMAGSPAILKAPERTVVGDGAGWLVVDDLVDKGATAEAVRRLLPAARYAAIYAKPAGRPFADVVAVMVDQDEWLRFPWESTQPALS